MLVVDAGPVVAAASTNDRDHQACADLLSEADRPLVVPSLVVVVVPVHGFGTIVESCVAEPGATLRYVVGLSTI